MFLRSAAFLFISLLALRSYAARDLIVFVSAAKEAVQIAVNDYSSSQEGARNFEALVKEANAKLPEASRPVVLNLEVNRLEEIPEKMEALTAQNPALAKSTIRMMYLLGHGNPRTFYLHSDLAYTGKEVAAILNLESMRTKLNKDIGIYIGACKCGQNADPTTFQVELMSEFKVLNEQLPQENQVRSLVTLAHRFSSDNLSYKSRSYWFDTVLYNHGVFKVISRLDLFFFKKLGRYVSAFSGPGIAVGLYAMASVLQNHVSPDAVGPAITSLLAVLPKIGAGIGVSYTALSFMSAKWTQKMEYTTSAGISTREAALASGDGVWQMIRMTGLTCERLF